MSHLQSMFLLQSKRERDVKGLGELPGVEFPDLNSLDGYLRHWGSHHVTRDRVLYTWLNEEGSVLGQRTYRELHLNASCIAQKLLSNQKPPIKPGDRVLLIYVPGLDFIDAFFGCLRAKVLPVPVLPPDPFQRGGQALLKIEYIAKSCGAVAILSTLSYHSAVRVGKVKNMIGLMRENGKSSAVWPKLPWMHTDSWIKKFANLAPDAMTNQSEPHSDDVSFLQFTSGSTGDAKGVMITHGGLIHNVKLMRRRYKSTSRTVLVSWLPQYHDMGLIGGLFTALVSGGTAILFSPMTFIKNPLLWLHVMSTYKATHSAGPNFAFELVARRLEANKGKAQTYDLSSMVFLMIAAEPVRKTTLKKFLEFTSPFGLTEEVMAPGYGLAENCVFVSCAFGEGIPIFIDWQGRVCCGYVDQGNADIDIRIVNPGTGTELEEDGKEGEIWISSPSAGIGYWGRKELSQDTFRNELQNHHGRRYTRTGDLGRVIDGKLFITGRIKDLIIAAGRNIYPADVEKTVESSSDLLRPGCCAVIGVPEEILMEKGIPVPDCSDQVGLVVIAEVKDGKPVAKDIIDQIQNRVAEEHGVSVASVKLIKPRTISKTTSGKIKRFECLKQFVDGTLNVVPEAIKLRRNFLRSFSTGTCKEGNTPRPQLTNLSRAFVQPSVQPGPRISNKDIEEFLKGLVSELTNIPINKICATESLLSYGIDSILVVRAAQKLSNFLGVPVGAVDIFTATCIADLASISENILTKNHAQSTKNTANPTFETTCALIEMEKISWTRRFGIWFFQLLALILVAMMLAFPAYLSISAFISSMPILHTFTDHIPLMNYLLPLTLAPLAWILCIVSSCMCISFLGNSFLRPNYALTPEVSIWSMDFVKWWAFYKAQEVSSKVLAVHLRGTVFLKYWYEMFGARIGSSVILDTIGITDPSLVSIGDGVVIAEGALIQSHEVKNGVLSFLPIRIGQNSSVGPYASIHKGAILGEEVEVPALQKIEGIVTTSVIGNLEKRSKPQRTAGERQELVAIYHFLGIYLLGFLGSLSAAIVYYFYIWLSQSSPSLQHLAFICLVGAFHWMPFTVIAYATIFAEVPSNATSSAILFSSMYLFHGIIFCILTFVMKSLLTNKSKMEQNPLKIWLCHRIITASHLRFANLLSGTEAFCIYLRLLGAVIGKHCSIRAINPVLDPELIYIHTGVHLGDFSRIISGFYSTGGLSRGKIEIQENSVIGSQSIVLPGTVIQEDVILGALSVAPMNSTLIKGGVYVGSRTPVMIKNTMHMLDERIEKMDTKYKKIVGNLSANLAATTLKVKTRYFHRIGVSGKGHLKIYDNIKGLPDHKIFSAGKSYPVFIRHSNSLSADDDARIDARGAALRILSDGSDSTPLLDLTLKTGNAFYARTIADFATWLVCGLG